MKRNTWKKMAASIALCTFFSSSMLMASANILISSGTITNTSLTADVNLRVQTGATTSRGSQNIYAVTYNYNNPNYDLVLGGSVYGLKTTTTMASEVEANANYNVVAGVNGDHFSTATGIPLGFSMDDGIIFESPVTDTDADGYLFHSLGITRSGDVVAGYNPTLTASVKKANGTCAVSIDRINRTRESWTGAQLSLFTGKYGSSTYEQSGGYELVVQVTSGAVSAQSGPLTGTVVSTTSAGNASIGAGQVVLSGEGSKATALMQYAVGDAIEMNFSFTDDRWNAVDFAISGNYTIVSNGVAQEYAYSSSSFTAAAQRTAFGIKADGTAVIVATDGRNIGGAVGFTANDMAHFMAEDMGCKYAILLDGGGSTTMVTMNSSRTPVVRNTLSGGQRSVGNGLFLVSLNTQRSVPTQTMMPNGAYAVDKTNASIAYSGSALSITAGSGGGSITYAVNKTYPVRQFPNLFMSVVSGVGFDIRFNLTDTATPPVLNVTPGLSADWGPSFGVAAGSPIPSGTYTNRKVTFMGCMAWNNTIPANGLIRIHSVTISLAAAGTLTVNNLYMAPIVSSAAAPTPREILLNLMPKQGVTTSPTGIGGSTGILTPTYNANGSVTLTNSGTSWPSVRTVYNLNVDLNAAPILYYDFNGIVPGNHTGVNSLIWYGTNSYLQLSQMINGTVNDVMQNSSGSINVKEYMQAHGIYPADGLLRITNVTISVATWQAGSSATFNAYRFGPAV